MDIEKLKREEEEAIKLMYGTVEEEQPDETVEDEGDDESTDEVLTVNDEDFDDDEPIQEVTVDQDEDDVSDVSEKKSRMSWKKRYANYKASTDQTIYDLRQTVAYKSSRIADLEEQIEVKEEELRALKAELNKTKDPFEGIVTPEDEELIGPEAVEIIKKIAGSRKGSDDRYEELLAKMKAMEKEKRERLKRESEDLKQESMTQLKRKLSNLVPNWQRIDIEKDFETYMKDVDPISGRLRSELFKTAIATRDVERVASFYNNYQSLKPKSKKEILSSKVTPVGSKASKSDDSVGESEKVYTLAEYTKFMDDVARGAYRATKELRQLAKKKERQFDKAYAEGRLK